MERKPIPTAPAERAKRAFANPTVKSRRVSWVLYVCIFLSVLSGFLGSIFARSYPSTWPLAKYIIISDSASPELVFVDSGPDATSSELVSILQARQGKTIVSAFPNPTAEYSDETELGKGVIISTDGWMVLLNDVAQGRSSLTIVLSDGRVFVTTELIEDKYSGIVFAKIDASQLPVIDFRTSDLQLGEPIVLYTQSVTSGDRVAFGQIENTTFNTTTEFSTQQPNYIYLTDAVSRPEYLGSPVFDFTGNMVGLNLLDHQILPVSEISRNVFAVFSKQAITHHSIDIVYTPLYHTIDPDNGFRRRGAEVLQLRSAVPGLAVGDSIVEVNGVDVDKDNDLSRLLADIPLGTEAELKISRAGEQKVITIEVR